MLHPNRRQGWCQSSSTSTSTPMAVYVNRILTLTTIMVSTISAMSPDIYLTMAFQAVPNYLTPTRTSSLADMTKISSVLRISTFGVVLRSQTSLSAEASATSSNPYFLDEDDGWTSLSGESRGVWWRPAISERGREDVQGEDAATATTTDASHATTTIRIRYSGTLVGEDWWTPIDVVECWLNEIQGMGDYADKFLENQVDATDLLDPELFTESYVQTTLGIDNKIQCKKIVMASKRLQKVREDFPVGYEFDSNDNFEIDDNKRLIRGMRLAVDALLNMNRRHDGDVAAVMSASLVCRSDFAYGSEGYRKSNGDVVVPPFATLRFNIDVLS